MEEEKQEKVEEKTIQDKVKEATEKKIDELVKQGLSQSNIDYLYKVVDIHKDISNEEYWKAKEEKYMFYGEDYGRRDGRGRYMDGTMGRRGVPGSGRGRYRGKEIMDEMAYHYGNYTEGRDTYGADAETMKSFKYMLKSFEDYYKHLKQEASSQEEIQMLEDTARKISEL